jgi:GntR family transcriptional regulator
VIRLDPTGPVAPFEQIRAQIADRIRYGSLPAGQRLPSIRQLAGDLRVANGTVAKAYSALEAEGLIETSRSRGTVVATGRGLPEHARRAAQRYVEATEDLGLEQALSAVRAVWDDRRNRS